MIGRVTEEAIQCGRTISGQELDEIRETIEMFPRLSLTELTDTVCEHLGWLTASGRYKRDACFKLLKKLESGGVVRLPKKREIRRDGRGQKGISVTVRTEARSDLTCDLGELNCVRVEVVKNEAGAGLWNEYVSRYHYLGYKKPFGTFLRYFIVCDRGLLGCVLFAGAAKALGVRDRWIGWEDKARLRNLGWVINNTRFLIFKWVHIKNLASHILGQVGRRIGEDWNERWGYQPVLMETFVDPGRYHGSCYRASNWEYLGMTTGGGLVRKGKEYSTSPKMIFVKPLAKDFRSLLCSDQLKGRVEG